MGRPGLTKRNRGCSEVRFNINIHSNTVSACGGFLMSRKLSRRPFVTHRPLITPVQRSDTGNLRCLEGWPGSEAKPSPFGTITRADLWDFLLKRTLAPIPFEMPMSIHLSFPSTSVQNLSNIVAVFPTYLADWQEINFRRK